MKSSNPIDFFFSLGDKATKGDPVKKARFDYYLMWVIFFAFLTIGLDNFQTFFETGSWRFLGWGVVMLCILWFQYFGLKMSRSSLNQMIQFRKSVSFKKDNDVSKVENEAEMLNLFSEKDGGK